tara:strand:- start:4 stop:1158 length:1155 start_codon:yes stop_codon:yes gene_type:complete
MDKLSQKELLDEGFLSGLRAVTKPLAKLAAGTAGAVAAASRAGTSAGIGDVVGGFKAGKDKEKIAQRSKGSELDKALEDLGYKKLNPERYAKGKFGFPGETVAVDVAELDYDGSGNQVKGDTFGTPLVLKWDGESKSFSVARSPRKRGDAPKPQPKPKPEERGQGSANPGSAIAKAYDNQDKLAAQQAAKNKGLPPPSPSALKTQPSQPKLGAAFNQPKDKPEAKPAAKKVPPPSQSALQPKAKLGSVFNQPEAKKVPPPSASALQAKPKLGDAFKKSASKPKSDFFASTSKSSADASGKKSNTPKKKKSSDTEDATYRRIKRAIDSRKMPKRKDVELYVNTHGKDAKNVIGGVQLRRLLNNKDKLREKLSQKNLMRQLTLLFK